MTSDNIEIRKAVPQNIVQRILNNAANSGVVLGGSAGREYLTMELRRWYNTVIRVDGGLVLCKDLKPTYEYLSSKLSRDRHIYIKYRSDVSPSIVRQFIEEVTRIYPQELLGMKLYPTKIMAGKNVSEDAKQLCKAYMITAVSFDGKQYQQSQW
jgi:hypothetical protein